MVGLLNSLSPEPTSTGRPAEVDRAGAVPTWEVDPASDGFKAIQSGFEVDETRVSTLNPHTFAVAAPIGAWAARHGLADGARVAKALERSRFNVLAGYGHPGADYEGFLLTAKWCSWLFFQDDLLCDRHEGDGGVLGPDALAEAHRGLLAALMGELPPAADPLATSIHEIGREIVAWRGVAHLNRFAADVRDYFWGNEWEALNRVRGQIPSVSAFTKLRPHAGAAYTAFQFWEIVEDFDLGEAGRDHAAARELRLLANNCISWANDLYSLSKEIREGNPNNLVLAIAQERRAGLVAAMRETVDLYNLEYRAFLQLAADLSALGLGGGSLDLRSYADRLHGWMIGNIRWSRLTPRYREELAMNVRGPADLASGHVPGGADVWRSAPGRRPTSVRVATPVWSAGAPLSIA